MGFKMKSKKQKLNRNQSPCEQDLINIENNLLMANNANEKTRQLDGRHY